MALEACYPTPLMCFNNFSIRFQFWDNRSSYNHNQSTAFIPDPKINNCNFPGGEYALYTQTPITNISISTIIITQWCVKFLQTLTPEPPECHSDTTATQHSSSAPPQTFTFTNVARLLVPQPGSVLLPVPEWVTWVAMFLKLDIYYCMMLSPAAYRSPGLYDRNCYGFCSNIWQQSACLNTWQEKLQYTTLEKEQSYEDPAGSKSFHSYNGLRRLFTVWLLKKNAYKQLCSAMIYLFTSLPYWALTISS